MSIRIYNGYIWEGPGDLEGLFRALGDYVSAAGEACGAAVAGQYAEQACRYLDETALGRSTGEHLAEELAGGAGLLTAISLQAENRRSVTLGKGIRSPDHDWECTVHVFVLSGHAPLVRLVAEKGDVYTPAFMNIPGIRPWPFWNNSDRPRDVSGEEWEDRRDAWGRTYSRGADRALTARPLCLHVMDERGIAPSPCDITAAQPGIEERASARAKEFLRRGWVRDWCLRNGSRSDPGGHASMRHVMEALWAYDSWAVSEEGKAAVTVAAFETQALLPHRYTEEELTAPPAAADRAALPLSALV